MDSKMKLYSLMIYDSKYNLLYSNHNLDDFNIFIRYSVKSTIESYTNNLIRKAESNNQYKINDKIDDHEFTIHGSTFNGFCVIITVIQKCHN